MMEILLTVQKYERCYLVTIRRSTFVKILRPKHYIKSTVRKDDLGRNYDEEERRIISRLEQDEMVEQ